VENQYVGLHKSTTIITTNLLCSSFRAADNCIIQPFISVLADLLLCDGCKYNEGNCNDEFNQ